MDAPPPNHHTGDNVFLQELQGTHHPLLNPYGEIDWPVYEYHNPFASSLAPALDYDNTSSVGTVDEPFSPISDTTPVGPSMMPSDFKLPNPYDIDHAHINANRFNCSLNHDAAGPAFSLSELPDMLDLPDTSDLSDTLDLPDVSDLHDTSGPYDHLLGYGHRSHFAYGAGTDAYSYAERSRGVNVSPGEVPLTFMYPGALVIADQEDPPAAPQVKKERSEASPTSSTPRRTTRGRQVPVNDVAEEDSGSDGKPAKGGKPEYRCQFCPSVFDRSYNRNVHVAAVHEGKKGHVCPHATCAQAFSRKHDLLRHIQSFHTTLGSPRRHPPAHGEHGKNSGKWKN